MVLILQQVREIPIQLQRLFASLMLENQKALSSKDLTNSFGWSDAQVIILAV
jgi:ubiquitin carboxyl-terminal hydrolase 40